MSYQYVNLERHLKAQDANGLTLSFVELEKVLGFALPASAHKYKAWWANQRDFAGRPQAQAWLVAGFEVDAVNIDQKTVRFRRAGPARVAPITPATVRATSPAAKPAPSNPDARKIVLISCVAQKLDRRSAAKDLYTSPLFTLNYAYALKLDPAAIYILSAKYGLVAADEIIDAYDATLNNMRQEERRAWAEKVLKQLTTATKPENYHFVLLAGERYREHLVKHLPSHEVPLQGLTIGRQLQRLKELLDE